MVRVQPVLLQHDRRSARGSARSRRAGVVAEHADLAGVGARGGPRGSRRSVVLPAPLGPSSASSSPRRDGEVHAVERARRRRRPCGRRGIAGRRSRTSRRRLEEFVHADRIGPRAPPRHRRAGRTCVSTRGWRRIHPRADEGRARRALPLCVTSRPARADRRPAAALRRARGRSRSCVSVVVFDRPAARASHGDGLARHRSRSSRCRRPACVPGRAARRVVRPARAIAGLALVGVAELRVRRRPARQRRLRRASTSSWSIAAACGSSRDAAIVVCGGTVAGGSSRSRCSSARTRRDDQRAAVLASLPWFLVMRLMRQLRAAATRRGARRGAARVARRARRVGGAGRARPASRASCTTCSRTRCRRSRCSSRARGCWRATAAPTPRSSTALERAHHLAADGLDEARAGDRRAARRRAARARSDLRALADGFGDRATLTVTRRRRASSPPRRGWRSTAPPRRR